MHGWCQQCTRGQNRCGPSHLYSKVCRVGHNRCKAATVGRSRERGGMCVLGQRNQRADEREVARAVPPCSGASVACCICSCHFVGQGTTTPTVTGKNASFQSMLESSHFLCLARPRGFGPLLLRCSSVLQIFLSLFDVHAFGFFYLLRGALWRRTQKAWRGWYV